MTTARSAVLPLAEVGGSDRASAGGKAAMLGELRRRGFAVPDGVVLTVAGQLAGSLPAGTADALDAARRRLGGTVAVRSSAPDEDTAASSAAGRYATVLDVADRQALLAAVRACWASATGSAMAVLVQRMVPASTAGVAFTADPVTGERDVVVVVAGLPGAVTEGGSGQEWRLRMDRDGPGFVGRPTAERAVSHTMVSHTMVSHTMGSHPMGGRPGALAPALVRAVAQAAIAAAEVVGGPADVEWAVEDGAVIVLQARPMTALPDPVRWVAPLPGGWLRNFRLGEWLPGPVTPLFETWFVDAVEAGIMRRAGRDAGLVMAPPLHVVVNGWYFHAPLGTDPVRTLLGALVRNPRFFLASTLVGSRPEWTDRLVIRRFTRSWPAALAAQEAAAERLRRTVADPGAEAAALVTAVDEVADAVAGAFWSLAMVGGFAWKVEAVLRRVLVTGLPVAEATHLASWLSQPPTDRPFPVAPHAVRSLDLVHPVGGAPAVPARRPAPAAPDVGGARAALGRRRWRRVERLGLLVNRYARLREEQAAALTPGFRVIQAG